MSEHPSSRPGVGIAWMVFTGVLFVMVTGLVKYLGPTMPAPQAAFLRYALGLILLVPMLPFREGLRLQKHQLRLSVWRGVLHSGAVTLWFFAMARIPIADVTAMNYMAPIYVTIGAALFLGERLALRRLGAIAFALLGVIIILRPGFREIGAGHMAMVLATLFFGASYLLAKRLTDEMPAGLVVVLLSVIVTIALLPMALVVWVPPSGFDLIILFLVACIATLGHYTMTLAFKATSISVTQPVTFLQLVWAVTLGVVVFGEAIDPFVVLGGVIILASVTFISWREATLQRRLRTPPVPATKV
ncbi:DMT family transporter [Paracoccaceae bacterium]|jgi:drug/metabolite transporter (DMT)-like permease|nr:DMT family transporter [Paracoccaceae bacterium]MBT6300729.1 DMT family transporter [Paracoccaceae bacterium]MDB3912712.1 DMT family transporter [Paracoccaceae bacterium]HBS39660.1 EamA family transporter [Paracoccaceae bacterium]